MLKARQKKANGGVLILLCWMLALVGLPLIYIVVLSFLSRGEHGGVVYRFSLENYARIFDPLYARIFLMSAAIALLTTVISLAVGYPFAYFATKVGEKYRFVIITLALLPFWTSSLLRAYGWMILLQVNGVINTFLMGIGIIDKPLRFMYNYGAVLLGTVYMLLPFMILPIYNSLDRMDKSLVEASRDLGAGRFQTFVKVVFPLSLPGVTGGMTLVFIPAVGLYFISDLLGGAKTMLLGNLIQNQVAGVRNRPFAAALSILLIIGVSFFVKLYSSASKASGGKGGGLF